jgi:hypothetical protein
MRIVQALPPARDAIVAGLALFTLRINDDFPEVVYDSVTLLVGLLREWERMVSVERPAFVLGPATGGGMSVRSSLQHQEPVPPAPKVAPFTSLSKVEAAALGLLCSNVPAIRHLAMHVATTARAVHLKLGVNLLRAPSTGDPTAPAAAPSATTAAVSAAVLRSSSGGRNRLSSLSTSASLEVGSAAGRGHRRLSSVSDRASQQGLHTRRGSIQSSVDMGAPAFPPTPQPGTNVREGFMVPPTAQPGTPLNGGAPLGLGSVDGIVESTSAATAQYLADSIEHGGETITRRCYWDFGRWSDVWRAWRAVPEAGATFMTCLQRRDTIEVCF